MTYDVVKILIPSILAFIVGIAMTPALSAYMYKKQLWRRKSRSQENTEAMSAEFQKIHNEKGEKNTPRVGGVLIWFSVLVVIMAIAIVSFIYPHPYTIKMNFLSTNQTILPLFALIFGSIIGLADDLLQIFGKEFKMTDGISRKLRVLVVLLIGAVGAWWFFFKLETLSIHVPFYGDLYLGLFFIPFFMFVILGTFSSSVIDGIDGLAAGVMSAAFTAYGIIAFTQNQIDLATFCAVIVGATLAFLWFNIPPARFYLGETGMLGLTVTLAIVAFLTDQVLVLPIIGLPLVLTSLSSFIQMNSKKYFGVKVFRIAPLHHHFEALGWPSYKVTMRYWVISIIAAVLGTIIALVG